MKKYKTNYNVKAIYFFTYKLFFDFDKLLFVYESDILHKHRYFRRGHLPRPNHSHFSRSFRRRKVHFLEMSVSDYTQTARKMSISIRAQICQFETHYSAQ